MSNHAELPAGRGQTLTAADLLALRQRLGLTQPQMAQRLYIGLRTYKRYERGEQSIPKPVQALARTLTR